MEVTPRSHLVIGWQKWPGKQTAKSFMEHRTNTITINYITNVFLHPSRCRHPCRYDYRGCVYRPSCIRSANFHFTFQSFFIILGWLIVFGISKLLLAKKDKKFVFSLENSRKWKEDNQHKKFFLFGGIYLQGKTETIDKCHPSEMQKPNTTISNILRMPAWNPPDHVPIHVPDFLTLYQRYNQCK